MPLIPETERRIFTLSGQNCISCSNNCLTGNENDPEKINFSIPTTLYINGKLQTLLVCAHPEAATRHNTRSLREWENPPYACRICLDLQNFDPNSIIQYPRRVLGIDTHAPSEIPADLYRIYNKYIDPKDL